MIETVLCFLSFDKYPGLISSLAIILSVMLCALLLRILHIPLRINHFISSGLAMYLFIIFISDGNVFTKFYVALVKEQKFYDHYLQKPLFLQKAKLDKIKIHRNQIKFFLTFWPPQPDRLTAQDSLDKFMRLYQKKFCAIITQENARAYRHMKTTIINTDLKETFFYFQNPKNSSSVSLKRVARSSHICHLS